MASEKRPGRLKGDGENWPYGPLAVAVVCGFLAFLSAPDAAPAPWLSPLLTTAAAVIATLFVALALGARQIAVKMPLAILTMIYVGLGEAAAVGGLSTGLPAWTYAWLLAITVGSGVGALLSAVIVGAKALNAERIQIQEGRVVVLSGEPKDE
jgi:hypothetical protein